MSSEKLYLSERQNIIGAHGNRAKMAAFIVDSNHRYATDDSPWNLIGVWVLVPMTGQYQRVITLLELGDGWEGFERMIHSMMIEPPSTWHGIYEDLDEWRLGGEYFVMEAGPGCPSVADLVAQGVTGSMLAYERADVTPGGEQAYLEAVIKEWAPVAESHGYTLIGNYIAAKMDGVVFTAWACERADHTSLIRSPEARAWRKRRAQLSNGWREELWIAAAGSPFAGAETVAGH
jgi:hypothetical protein